MVKFFLALMVIVSVTTVADASCIYNDAQYRIAFSSQGSSTNGYSSDSLATGNTRQCWYNATWSNGYIGYQNELANFLAPAMPIFAGISFSNGHDWIVVSGTGWMQTSGLGKGCYVITSAFASINHQHGGSTEIGVDTNSVKFPQSTCNTWAPVPS